MVIKIAPDGGIVCFVYSVATAWASQEVKSPYL